MLTLNIADLSKWFLYIGIAKLEVLFKAFCFEIYLLVFAIFDQLNADHLFRSIVNIEISIHRKWKS